MTELNNTKEMDTMLNLHVQQRISHTVMSLDNYVKGGLFSTEKGDQKTNIIDQGMRRTYHIPDENLCEFFTRLEACRKDGAVLHWSEKQAPMSGIMMDFDIFQRCKERIIDEKVISRIAGKIHSVLTRVLVWPKNELVEFHVFVIRRPEVTQVEGKDYFKDGLHILVPEVWISKPTKIFVQNEVSRGMRSAMNGIKDSILNIDSCLDMNSKSVPVLFVGNCKRDKRTPYFLEYSYRAEIDSLDIEDSSNRLVTADVPTDINLIYELSLSCKMDFFAGKATWLSKMEYQPSPKYAQAIQEMTEREQASHRITDDVFDAVKDSVSALCLHDAEAAHLQTMLMLLDRSFSEDYNAWKKVIWAIAHTSPAYKPIAEWFSQRSGQKWDQAAFDQIWEVGVRGMRDNGNPLTKRSIEYWARHSNPEKYKEAMDNCYQQKLFQYLIEDDGDLTQAKLANLIHMMLGNKFVLDKNVDGEGKVRYIWYEFVLPQQQQTHGEVYKYREEHEPDNLHLFIGEHMPKIFKSVLNQIREYKDNADEENKVKYWANLERQTKKTIHNLGQHTQQNGIIAQAKFRFRKRGFCASLDTDSEIFGVGNGVIRLTPQPSLIKTFHEYAVCKYTPTDYIPYDERNPRIREVLAVLRDIIIEPDAFHKIMCALSTTVDRRSGQPYCLIMKAAGANGKSSLQGFTASAVGPQNSCKAPMSLLTNKTPSGEKPNAAHFMMKGKTHIYFDESQKAEVVNMQRLKELTSPIQTGRGLRRDQENFQMVAMLFALSNFDWIVETSDHGTWRRILYYVPKITFRGNPNPDNKYERKENPEIINRYAVGKDPEWNAAFLSVLIHYNEILYNKYGYDLKNVPSDTIARETEDFRNRNDTMNLFINQMIVSSPGHTETYPVTEIAAKYIDWHAKNIGEINRRNVADIHEKIYNSKIQNSLINCGNGTRVLHNHRILEDPSSKLEKHERYLFVPESAGQDAAREDAPVDLSIPETIKPKAVEIDPEMDSEFRTTTAYEVETKSNMIKEEPIVCLEDLYEAFEDDVDAVDAAAMTENDKKI